METSISKKMFAIADALHELNSRREVKAFKGNEKGYAKVLQIVRGCSIFVHHLKDDRLIVNLRITSAAENNAPNDCRAAVRKFQRSFDGWLCKQDSWDDLINAAGKRYYIDITRLGTAEILEKLNNLRSTWNSL